MLPSPSRLRPPLCGFPCTTPSPLDGLFQPAAPLSSCVPLRSNGPRWYGILHPLPFAYALRPRLRSRLTLGGRTFPRNPSAFGGQDSHLSFVTYTGILTSRLSTRPCGRASPHAGTLPYHSLLSEASVAGFSPVSFSAQPHSTSELLRTLSMMAASKPTSWLSSHGHFLSHLTRPWGP